MLENNRNLKYFKLHHTGIFPDFYVTYTGQSSFNCSRVHLNNAIFFFAK